MSNETYVSVPEANTSPNSLSESIRALKHNMDLLTGKLKGQSTGAPQMFVQSTTPSTIHTGDLWINTSTNKMSYWDGRNWTSIVV